LDAGYQQPRVKVAANPKRRSRSSTEDIHVMLAASDFQDLPGNHLYSVIKATQTYVVLDTGATETAAGLQQADDLIRALREFNEIWVEVSRDQLPCLSLETESGYKQSVVC